MRIVKIHINEFGPLKDKSFEFDENLTIVKGDNESGKSSLMLFIKFALYGLSKKSKNGSVAEIERALSHSTGTASGYMIVSLGEKLYRIDRQARRSAKSILKKVQLTDAISGLKCEYSGSPGEFLLGIPADIFDNSSNISQLGCATVKGKEIGTAIKNLLSSADESIDSQKALKALDNLRIKFLHKNKNGGSIFNLTNLKDQLNERYTKAVEDSCETERIEAELKKTESMIEDVASKQKIADELVSRIGLRTVVKQFDKLHEYEDEKKKIEEKLDDINKKTSRGELSLDRNFVATLKGIAGELTFAYNDKCEADEALKKISMPEDEKIRLIIEKTDSCGGTVALESFFENNTKSKKAKTAAAVVLATLAIALVPIGFLKLGFLPVPAYFVALPLSLLLFVLAAVSFGARAKAVKALKNTCKKLGISQNGIKDFLARSKEAFAERDKRNELCKECIAEQNVKERVLASAINKALDLFSLYGIALDSSSAENVIKTANETATQILTLCDDRDILSGKLVALEAKISEISIELTDYNEHQTRRRVSNDILEMSDTEIRTAKTNKEFYANQLKALGEKKLAAERVLIARKYSTYDPFDISARLSEATEKLEAQTKTYNAIELAIESITTASANLRNTIAPQIRAHAHDYMSSITDGKYDSVSVDDTLELSMSEDGFSYNIDSFSAGTKDAAYLALRLSLLLLTGDEETAPLLMDETLAMIDDKRAKKLLSMLVEHSNQHGQCILFSCHDREERLCREDNITFTKIEM